MERLRQQKRLQFNLSRLRVHKNETVQAKIKRLDDTTHKHDEKLSRLERDLEQKLAKLKNQMEREFDKKLEASLRRIAFAANKGSAPSYAPVASPSKGLALLIDKHQRSSRHARRSLYPGRTTRQRSKRFQNAGLRTRHWFRFDRRIPSPLPFAAGIQQAANEDMHLGAE